MTISLFGDGIYFIAIVWEALRLSNTATAVSLVGVAWTLPTVAFLVVGGALSDRVDRRQMMVAANVAQALAIGIIGLLDLTGQLQFWDLLVLVAFYGGAQAFFVPAFEAIVPTLVDPDELAHASALDEFVRPLAVQLVGPAAGGFLIALAGTGAAFLVDALTFLVAAGTVMAMPALIRSPGGATGGGGALDGLAEAARFVRANPWLSRTLLAAGLMLLVFVGPSQVLLPLLIKNDLHAGSDTLGVIRAFGGLGAVAAAFSISQFGLPGRLVSAMFAGWTLQCLALAGYAAASGTWIFAVISLCAGGCGALGNVIWGTMMKTRVPNALLGRVVSLDWLVSIGLVPASFAITGPVAQVFGVRTTLLTGGLIGASTLVAFAVLPGTRRPDRAARPNIRETGLPGSGTA
jgi:MFS family permease